MADWLRHPRYKPIRDDLVDRLRGDHFRFGRLPSVAFLCGARASRPREILRQFLEKRDDIINFYAEDVWYQLAQRKLSALKVEGELAKISDVVIVIVESPGTFAELGAFSFYHALRKKLLPILDKKHKDANSFINTGPVRWVDRASLFKPTIYVNLRSILEASNGIEERLARLPQAKPSKVTDLSKNPKHFLFFLCDLVSITGPITFPMVAYYASEIAGPAASKLLPSVLGLAVSMKLIQTIRPQSDGGDEGTYYFRSQISGLAKPFHKRRMLDLPSVRARHLSVLQKIGQARTILKSIGVGA